MINPSYDGIIKIGKTTREPEERAKELSSATGVATPFIVVYKRMFKNCHLAEALIHNYLSDKGYRVNDSREFFSIPIYEAINLIVNLSDEDNNSYTEEQEYDEKDLKDVYFRMALDYELGENNKFIDFEKAIELYKKAALLGHVEAYHRIGSIYEQHLHNNNNAIEYYKQSAERGYFLSSARLGVIYMSSKRHYNEHNQHIAWSFFIGSLKDIDDTTKELMHTPIICGLYELILNYHKCNKPIPNEWANLLSDYKYDLLNYAKDLYDKRRADFDKRYKNYIGESPEYIYNYRLIQLGQKILYYISKL